MKAPNHRRPRHFQFGLNDVGVVLSAGKIESVESHEGKPNSSRLDENRRKSLRDLQARAAVSNTDAVQRFQGRLQTLATVVGNMVVGQRDHVEADTLQIIRSYRVGPSQVQLAQG